MMDTKATLNYVVHGRSSTHEGAIRRYHGVVKAPVAHTDIFYGLKAISNLLPSIIEKKEGGFQPDDKTTAMAAII